jgi:hypothetical protein
MISAVSSDKVARKKTHDGTRADFFGAAEIREGPQGFLVDLPEPGYTIKPHFHRAHQFIVVVAGGGRLGKHHLEPITVHYTDAFTPYGPTVGGPNGLAFFNLRSQADVGAYYMPGSHDKQERRAGRSIVVKVPIPSGRPQGDVEIRNLIDNGVDEDVRGIEIILGPETTAAVGHRSAGSGTYGLVLGGTLRWNGELAHRHSMMFAPSGDALDQIASGPDGLHMLLLQTPAGPGPQKAAV